MKRCLAKYRFVFSFLKLFFRPTWRKLLLIVFLSFISRLLVYGYIKIPWIIFDEFIYLDTARQIVRGHFLTELIRDPRLYPPGWPVLLAAFTGFIKDPFLQYQVGLLLTMIISSLAPILVYWLTGNLWASLLLSFYPPLFVYSNSIMSETFFILMLLFLLTLLKYIIRDDLNKRRSLFLAALILGFFIYFTRMVRSFGIILLPSLILAIFVVLYYQYRQKSFNRLKTFVYFTVLTVFFYYVFGYVSRLWFLPEKGFYEKTAYVDSLIRALTQPRFSFTLLRNEITLSLYWLFFVLPLFFYFELKKELHKKEWHLVLPRLWAVFIYLLSLGLTFAHMFIGAARNPQYLIFSRYLDPALVLLFVYGLTDFLKYLSSDSIRIKLRPLIFFILAYFIFYFIFKLPKLDYKFGNTMTVYFFLLFEKQPWLSFSLIFLVATIIYSLAKNYRRLLLFSLLFFFFWTSVLAINSTLETPRWVNEKYSKVIMEWDMALNRYQTIDIPICIHRDGVSSETYYLYHYMYPYQYLRNCDDYQNKPRRILTRKNHSFALPGNCNIDFRFDSGESIIYCPLGY